MKIKINKNSTGSLGGAPQAEIFVGENEDTSFSLKGVIALNVHVEIGQLPMAEIEVCSLSDQEFEIANDQCKIEVIGVNLYSYPIELLKEEIQRRERDHDKL